MEKNTAVDFSRSPIVSSFIPPMILCLDVFGKRGVKENPFAGYCRWFLCVIDAPGWFLLWRFGGLSHQLRRLGVETGARFCNRITR